MNLTENPPATPPLETAVGSPGPQPDDAPDRRAPASTAASIAQRAAVVCVVLGIVSAAAAITLERSHRSEAHLRAVEASTDVATELVGGGLATAIETSGGSVGALAAALLPSGADGGTVWHTARGEVLTVGLRADTTPTEGLAAEVLTSGRARADEVTVAGAPAVRVLTPVARATSGGIVLETVTMLGAVDEVIARERRVGLIAVATAALLAVAGLVTVDRRRELRVAEQAAALRAMVVRDARTMMDASDVERIKGDFLTTVSHEVRTPLQVVRGTAQLLSTRADAMTKQQVADLAGRLGANAQRLDSLLTDVLDLDRLGQGLVESRREPVRLVDALDTALRTVDLKGATVARGVGDHVVQATPAHIERILEHLLRNAVKYGADPGGAATIEVSADREGDATTFIVADRGQGIAPAERLRVFDPLYRIHDDRADPGTGVGLALVRRLTRLYGGRVWVEETRGGGAAIHVRVPDDGEPLTIDTWNLSSTVDARHS